MVQPQAPPLNPTVSRDSLVRPKAPGDQRHSYKTGCPKGPEVPPGRTLTLGPGVALLGTTYRFLRQFRWGLSFDTHTLQGGHTAGPCSDPLRTPEEEKMEPLPLWDAQ